MCQQVFQSFRLKAAQQLLQAFSKKIRRLEQHHAGTQAAPSHQQHGARRMWDLILNFTLVL